MSSCARMTSQTSWIVLHLHSSSSQTRWCPAPSSSMSEERSEWNISGPVLYVVCCCLCLRAPLLTLVRLVTLSQFWDFIIHQMSLWLRSDTCDIVFRHEMCSKTNFLNYGVCFFDLFTIYRHEVRWDTLDKFPTSRLGRLRHCVTHRGEMELTI